MAGRGRSVDEDSLVIEVAWRPRTSWRAVRLLRRVAGDGGFNLPARHSFADVGVVGNGLEGNVGHRLVLEATPDAFLGVGQFIVVVDRCHQAGPG